MLHFHHIKNQLSFHFKKSQKCTWINHILSLFLYPEIINTSINILIPIDPSKLLTKSSITLFKYNPLIFINLPILIKILNLPIIYTFISKHPVNFTNLYDISQMNRTQLLITNFNILNHFSNISQQLDFLIYYYLSFYFLICTFIYLFYFFFIYLKILFYRFI